MDGDVGSEEGREEVDERGDEGMKARVLLAIAAVFAAALLPIPAQAAQISASLVDTDASLGGHKPRMNPRALSATPGDSIRWTHSDNGYISGQDHIPSIHTVTAYYGSTFASPALFYGDTFTAPYSGGTVLYRCLYHSSLDTRVNPPGCDGMCGAIHDTTNDQTPPTAAITTPTGFVFTGAVRIDGVASDNRAVSSLEVRFEPIVEVPGVLVTKKILSLDASTMNPCVGCFGPSLKWTVRSDPSVQTSQPILNLPPGQYRVIARAVDPHGNIGDSAPIAIYVVQ